MKIFVILFYLYIVAIHRRRLYCNNLFAIYYNATIINTVEILGVGKSS